MSKKLLLKDAHIEGIRYFDVYRKQGGYDAVEKALKMTPDAITEEVKTSGLRGRGGAGRGPPRRAHACRSSGGAASIFGSASWM